MGSVFDYTAAFRSRLLECTNVLDTEALDHYMAGLKQGTRDEVLIHHPSSLHEAACWAERYDSTYYSRGRLMLLCSRVLVDQCHLAAASNHRAAATLEVVSLTQKGTASSIANSNSHSRCSNDHRARTWANIASMKDNASSVVVLALKPWSVN